MGKYTYLTAYLNVNKYGNPLKKTAEYRIISNSEDFGGMYEVFGDIGQ